MKVIAKEKGFYIDRIIEKGEVFDTKGKFTKGKWFEPVAESPKAEPKVEAPKEKPKAK